jgi:hypothetical protein
VKTAARANPTIYLIEKGTIRDKAALPEAWNGSPENYRTNDYMNIGAYEPENCCSDVHFMYTFVPVFICSFVLPSFSAYL